MGGKNKKLQVKLANLSPPGGALREPVSQERDVLFNI